MDHTVTNICARHGSTHPDPGSRHRRRTGGLLLSEILHRHGVDSVVLERHSRAHVLARVRAGVLEQTTSTSWRANGLAQRMDREGQVHDGMKVVWPAAMASSSM